MAFAMAYHWSSQWLMTGVLNGLSLNQLALISHEQLMVFMMSLLTFNSSPKCQNYINVVVKTQSFHLFLEKGGSRIFFCLGLSEKPVLSVHHIKEDIQAIHMQMLEGWGGG